jgi:sugar lactone lactonase YvrE
VIMRLAVLVLVALVLPVSVAGAAIDVEVVVDYDIALGEQPEGLAVDKRGDVYVSLSPLGQIWKIGRDGSESLVAQLVPAGSGFGPLGLAIDAPGNLYVAVATFNPATQGVYQVARDGSFMRLPGTGAILFPNGVTLDKRGNIYVTDTLQGIVWRIPAAGGAPEEWFESALLLGDGSAGIGVPIGANGIAYRQNELVVGNSEGARLLRIPIEPDGSAGTATILAQGDALRFVDGLAFDVHGILWAAVIEQSKIVQVSPTGDVTTVATMADGLDWTSSIAFGKNGDLWAVNFAIGPPGGPGPALLLLDVGVKGQPVP